MVAEMGEKWSPLSQPESYGSGSLLLGHSAFSGPLLVGHLQLAQTINAAITGSSTLNKSLYVSHVTPSFLAHNAFSALYATPYVGMVLNPASIQLVNAETVQVADTENWTNTSSNQEYTLKYMLGKWLVDQRDTFYFGNTLSPGPTTVSLSALN